MNFTGIIMGLFMLFFTGIGHVIVIKGEYHFGVKIWPVFFNFGRRTYSFIINYR